MRTTREQLFRTALLALAALPTVAACGREPSRDRGPAAAPPPAAPYAGLESRSIKALPPEDVERLLRGEGMGYALAAELNHYPGPRHVLELADSLDLTDAQRDSVQAIHDRMKAAAIDRGRELVAAEAELDSLFAARAVDAATLRERTARIGGLEGELRALHLHAHLETRAVLTDEQVARYDALRGYGAGGDHTHR